MLPKTAAESSYAVTSRVGICGSIAAWEPRDADRLGVCHPIADVGERSTVSVAVAVDTSLVGRDDELSRLDGYLAEIDTTGCALVLVGDPGAGKSALQSQMISLARRRGFEVLDARGSEAETYLPFACLHQLVRPLVLTPRPAFRPATGRAVGRLRYERTWCG